MMNIPVLDLKAQYESMKDEIEKKILEIVSSQKYILGPEVENLEKEIADYSGIKYGIGVSSGSDALIIALMALGVRHGDIVITTPFTFFATVGAIARVGARTVFCDIDAATYNMDPSRLEEVLEKECGEEANHRVKAIIPIHLFGQCADMAPILSLAKKYNISVIEDGAQAIGSEYPFPSGTKRANGMGDMGTLSFYPSKILGAFGDGGMVLTNSEEWAERLKILRVHGAKSKYFHQMLGGNFRLDNIQAGVLRIKLKYLDAWIQRRKEKADRYDTLLKNSGLAVRDLVQRPESVYKKSGVKNYHTYHQYVIRAKNRDTLQQFLKTKGVATLIYYPLSLHLQECFAELNYKKGDFPVSENATQEVLALPIYPEMNESQQEYVVSSIREFYSD
jgi:dTDP-4-amino-4,6-dideoxygalactose transaminase